MERDMKVDSPDTLAEVQVPKHANLSNSNDGEISGDSGTNSILNSSVGPTAPPTLTAADPETHVDLVDVVQGATDDDVDNFTDVPVGAKPEPILKLSPGLQQAPSNYRMLAIVATCTNLLMGPLALWFSFQSDKEWASGHPDTARQRARISLALSVLAICVSLVVVAVVLIYVVIGPQGMILELLLAIGT